MQYRFSTRQRQGGISLVEALIALLILSLGALGMAKLQSHLRLSADVARQRSEAVRLAQEDMEASRTFSTLDKTSAGPSYSEIVDASTTIAPSAERAGNTNFHVERDIAEGKGFRSVSVSVKWPDRAGRSQQVVLHSVIAATPPALSGALAMGRNAPPMKALRGRSPLIPATAKDLGNGSSALKPTEAGSLGFVFDNAGGLITSRCEHVATTTRTSELKSTDLIDCTAMNGMLLSGSVRVSLSIPPDPAKPADAALPFDVTVTLVGSSKSEAPICGTEQGERAVAYHCVISPTLGRWSGRSALVPRGWTIGLSAADRKVCRYSADQDGSEAVDSNAEHPNEYKDVDRPLTQQNFLIVRGDQPCPVPVKDMKVFADLSTVQHQP